MILLFVALNDLMKIPQMVFYQDKHYHEWPLAPHLIWESHFNPFDSLETALGDHGISIARHACETKINFLPAMVAGTESNHPSLVVELNAASTRRWFVRTSIQRFKAAARMADGNRRHGALVMASTRCCHRFTTTIC
jgi:hypothetical protein